MYRKSLLSGLLIGILLVLTLAFVVINDEAARAVPGWEGLGGVGVPRDLIRAFTLAASGVLLLFVGTLAAMRVRPARLQDGLKSGAISGLVVAIVVYILLFCPVVVIRGLGKLYGEVQNLQVVERALPENLLQRLGTQTGRLSLGGAFLVPIIGLVLGGAEGLVYTLLRRAGGHPTVEEPGPDFLDLVQQGETSPPRDRQENVLRAGLQGGLIIGGLLALEWLFLFLQAALEEGHELFVGMVIPSELTQVSAKLVVPMSILFPVAILLWGGIGVLLLRHPPTRFRSRFRATAISGTTGATMFSLLVGLPIVNMVLVFLPLGIAAETGERQIILSLDQLERVSRVLFFVYPLIPLVLVAILAIGAFGVGVPFVLLTPHTWPRRPVDRAARLAKRIRRQPETLLPEIYALFQRDRQPVEVLWHLGWRFQQDERRPAAAVAAAYHTLCQHPERMSDALRSIAVTLSAVEAWRWQVEIGELHRFLQEGLRAGNIRHLTAIRPLPEEQTSSLPAVLAQSGEHLSRIVMQVKKFPRLDDLNSRTICLNRALEMVTEAERFVAERMSPGKENRRSSALPEQRVLLALLPRWRGILHETLRDLRGRAALQVELQTRQAPYMPHLALHFRVTNAGLNVAERVRISLDPGPDYRLTSESEARIELLPPGEDRAVTLSLEPRNPRRMRVVLRIFYDDAVDENREMTVADEVVFVEEERPFQRIFPIPYVTGTPLRTREMFYGRQDVFDYVREHLLGSYQNNIIVLHGQRRTGKTSVLYQLPQVLEETHFCVLLDMQGVPARSEAEFFYALSDEISYSLERGGIEVELPPLEEYESQPELTFRARFLRAIYPKLGEKLLLLMFDEFEEIQGHVQEGRIGSGVFSFLRNLMQHEDQVDFLFAGTHKLEELVAEYWSILFNIATYKRISFLEQAEVERLVTEPVAPFGMAYDPLAVDHVYEVTAGQPFLTQLVCHELVAYHNEAHRSYITVADVDLVLERIAERGEAHFKYIWAEADPAERAVMLALAELLAHTGGATVEDVAGLSERRGRSLGQEGALHALLRLESRDIVARTALGAERFRFRVDLVRRWVAGSPQLADTVELR